jgi:MoxR-like ATPase
MRPSILARILQKEFESVRAGQHTPVMIWGPPGIGKSQIVAQIARGQSVPMVDVRLSQMEPSDLRGIPFRVEDRVEWAPPAILPGVRSGQPSGVLFLDEISSAAPSVSAAAYQLILDRRLGDYVVPDGWAIFAAGNRQGDRGVTYSMPAPLANRFTHYELEPHLEDWVAWAYDNGIDERVVAFLRFRAELLFDFEPAHAQRAFPSPRTWEFAHRALQKFGGDAALLFDATKGCVGEAAAVELNAFLRHFERLPDIDAMLRGESVAIPRDIDVQYAVGAALVSRVLRDKGVAGRPERLAAALRCAGEFPQREIGVMVVHDLARGVGAEIYKLPEFTRWAKDVGRLLL